MNQNVLLNVLLNFSLFLFFVQVDSQKPENNLAHPVNSTVPEGFVRIGQAANLDSKNNSDFTMNKPYLNKDMSTSNLTANSVSVHTPPRIGLQRFISSSVPPDLSQINDEKDAPINLPAAASSSFSVTLLILVSLVVVICIIGIILTALFVMRRRFSNWRLNGSSKAGCANEFNDGATGALTNGSNSENGSQLENKCLTIEVNETEKGKEAVLEGGKVSSCDKPDAGLTSVENKQAMLVVNSIDSQNQVDGVVKMIEEVNMTPAIVDGLKQQTSTSSVSLIIETNNANEEASVKAVSAEPIQNESVTANPTALIETPFQQQISSASIVNVLNEVSDSVVSMLAASVAKSPSKSALNSNDPENLK